MRDLDENAGTVAGQRVGADGAAVLEVLQDLQRVFDDLVRLAALHVGDEADAACIAFEVGIEEPLPLGPLIDQLARSVRRSIGLRHLQSSGVVVFDGGSFKSGYRLAGPRRCWGAKAARRSGRRARIGVRAGCTAFSLSGMMRPDTASAQAGCAKWAARDAPSPAAAPFPAHVPLPPVVWHRSPVPSQASAAAIQARQPLCLKERKDGRITRPHKGQEC